MVTQLTARVFAVSRPEDSAPPRELRGISKQPVKRKLPARKETSPLEERKASHQRASARPSTDPPLPPATELIFRLDRRGVGWGEEILPHLTVEQRVLKRNRSAQPDPWTVCSLAVHVLCTCLLDDPVAVTTVAAWQQLSSKAQATYVTLMYHFQGLRM